MGMLLLLQILYHQLWGVVTRIPSTCRAKVLAVGFNVDGHAKISNHNAIFRSTSGVYEDVFLGKVVRPIVRGRSNLNMTTHPAEIAMNYTLRVNVLHAHSDLVQDPQNIVGGERGYGPDIRYQRAIPEVRAHEKPRGLTRW